MDAFGVLGDVLADYESFVRGFLNIRDPEILRRVESEIERGLLWPEPWLALNPAFQPGGSVSELVDVGLLHPGCRDIFRSEEFIAFMKTVAAQYVDREIHVVMDNLVPYFTPEVRDWLADNQTSLSIAHR